MHRHRPRLTTSHPVLCGCLAWACLAVTAAQANLDDACVLCPGVKVSVANRFNTAWHALERYGMDLSCRSWEKYVYHNFTASSTECFLAQESNWECGCNEGFYGYLGTTSKWEKVVLIGTSRLVGIISLISVSFILIDFTQSLRQSVYRQLMALLASFDALTAMAWALGPLAIPTENESIVGAKGDHYTCAMQGFVVALGYGSIWVCVSLLMSCYLVIVRNWRERELEKATLWLLGLPIILSLVPAVVGLPVYDQVWTICYIQPTPFATTNHALYLSTIPIAIASVCCITLQILMYLKLRGSLSKQKLPSFVTATCEPNSVLRDIIVAQGPQQIQTCPDDAVSMSSLGISLGEESAEFDDGKFDKDVENLFEVDMKSQPIADGISEPKSSDANVNKEDIPTKEEVIEKRKETEQSPEHVREDGRRPGFMRRTSERSLWKSTFSVDSKDGEKDRPDLFRYFSDHDVTRENGKRPAIQRKRSNPSLCGDETRDADLERAPAKTIKKENMKKTEERKPTGAIDSTPIGQTSLHTNQRRDDGHPEVTRWVSDHKLMTPSSHLEVVSAKENLFALCP